MHFASSLTTFILAAQANAASLEADSNFLSLYESQYGLGLGSYPSGPSLPDLDLSYGYSAPSYQPYAPEPVYQAPAVTYREPLPDLDYDHDYVHAHVDYVD